MTKKLYAEDLFKKILTTQELKILETIWLEDLTEDQKLEVILKEIQKCSNSK